MILAVEMGEGLPVALLDVDEREASAVQEALALLVHRLGVEELVTDDPSVLPGVAERLGVKRQVWHFTSCAGCGAG